MLSAYVPAMGVVAVPLFTTFSPVNVLLLAAN